MCMYVGEKYRVPEFEKGHTQYELPLHLVILSAFEGVELYADIMEHRGISCFMIIEVD